MESVVREYQAWREKKRSEYQRRYSDWLERAGNDKQVYAAWHPAPRMPDTSFQAFLEEYEDTMPLDH